MKELEGNFSLEEIQRLGLKVTRRSERRAMLRALERELRCEDHLPSHGQMLMEWLTLDALLHGMLPA